MYLNDAADAASTTDDDRMISDGLPNNGSEGFFETSAPATKEKNMVEITKYVNGKKTKVWVDLNEMDEMMRAAWHKKQKKKPPAESKSLSESKKVNGDVPLASNAEAEGKENTDAEKIKNIDPALEDTHRNQSDGKKKSSKKNGEAAMASPKNGKKKKVSKKFHYSFPPQEQEQQHDLERLSLSERNDDDALGLPDASGELDDGKQKDSKKKHSKIKSGEAETQSNGKKRRGSKKFHYAFPKQQHQPEFGRQSLSEREADDSLGAFDELNDSSRGNGYGNSLSALLDINSEKNVPRDLASRDDSSFLDESVISAEGFFNKESEKRASAGIVQIEDVQMKPQISPRIEEKMKEWKSKSKTTSVKKKKKDRQGSIKSVKGTSKKSGKRATVKSDGTEKLLDIEKKSDDMSRAHRKRIKEIEKKLARIEQEKADEIRAIKKERKAEKSKIKHEFQDAKAREAKRIQELQESGQHMMEYFQKENQNLLDQAVAMKHDMITLKKQSRLLEKRRAEIDDRYESLKKWVERKTKSKDRREKLANDALTKYLPNHKEAMQRSNQICAAEYRIKEECRNTLERIVDAFQAKGTDRKLVRELLDIERECQQEVDDIPEVKIPRGLKSML